MVKDCWSILGVLTVIFWDANIWSCRWVVCNKEAKMETASDLLALLDSVVDCLQRKDEHPAIVKSWQGDFYQRVQELMAWSSFYQNDEIIEGLIQIMKKANQFQRFLLSAVLNECKYGPVRE